MRSAKLSSPPPFCAPIQRDFLHLGEYLAHGLPTLNGFPLLPICVNFFFSVFFFLDLPPRAKRGRAFPWIDVPVLTSVPTFASRASARPYFWVELYPHSLDDGMEPLPPPLALVEFQMDNAPSLHPWQTRIFPPRWPDTMIFPSIGFLLVWIFQSRNPVFFFFSVCSIPLCALRACFSLPTFLPLWSPGRRLSRFR